MKVLYLKKRGGLVLYLEEEEGVSCIWKRRRACPLPRNGERFVLNLETEEGVS